MKKLVTKPVVLLFFSAVLSALPLTFENAFLLSWFSFIPLFYVIITKSGDKLRYAIGRGFLFGLIYHICIYYWFLWFYPLDYVNLTSGSSVAVVCLAWFGISAVHGVLWCIPFICCYLVNKITKNSVFLSLVAILCIIATQKLTQIGELSFPWVRIALGQYKATALVQSASLFGIDGVDMLILTINALITVAICFKNKKRIAAIVAAFIIFSANLGFGIVKINQTQNGTKTTIMTVQASVPQDEKWDSDGDTICYDIYSSLTKDNITDDVELVLWPESAVPKVYKNQKALKQYKNLSKQIDTPILAGILLDSGKYNTNNTLLVDKSGVLATYTKRQLVPFGEYMPYQKTLSKIFPFLTELNIVEDDYVSGNSTAIMDAAGGKIGNIICFESIYPYLARKSVLDGAELMVEVTNDSWLKDSPAMKQHLAHGIFRSIENGRYLIRSANSGISAVIDPCGRVVSQLDVNERGIICESVYFCNQQTLYTKMGDILFSTLVIITLLWFVILLIKRIKSVN